MLDVGVEPVDAVGDLVETEDALQRPVQAGLCSLKALAEFVVRQDRTVQLEGLAPAECPDAGGPRLAAPLGPDLSVVEAVVLGPFDTDFSTPVALLGKCDLDPCVLQMVQVAPRVRPERLLTLPAVALAGQCELQSFREA